jgi:CheY-like chemotaxis protein
MAEAPTTDLPVAPVHTPQRKPTVLLVEDVPTTAEMTQIMIGKRATVLHATNPNESSEILNTILPDIILMDVNLGHGINGLDFVRTLRGNGLTVPIIAMTAYAMPKDRQAALDAGCNDYLPKPFTREDLLVVMRRNLVGKELQ